MIYFDNGATGGFKPQAVYETATNVMRYLSANPGRSGHRLSVTGGGLVSDCREILANCFNAKSDRVIFTKNCTEALNVAIFGCVKKGGRVITTAYEHNSVLRPLHALAKRGDIILDIATPKPDENIVKTITNLIAPETYMIVCTAVSNVTGESLPIEEIGKLAKANGLTYIIDCAQAGGHIPVDIKECNATAIALAGHKGLYGLQGVGVLILNDKADISPLIYGGTGSESFNTDQPSCYPERLESGTLNLPAIASLCDGVKYAYSNMENFAHHLRERTAWLINQLSAIRNCKCYSTPNCVGIVAFEIKGRQSTEIADILNGEYDIAVRGGLHCAPLMHKTLGTDDCGLVRVSLSAQNSARELSVFIRAIKSICDN